MTSSKAAAAATILLVDDNKHGLSARKHVLEELGFRALTATSGKAGLDLLSKNPVDLLVTDYKMPDMNGIELIQHVRRSAKADLPIVLISGWVDVMGLDSGTTGADVVLNKSANEVPQLVRAVNRLLHRPAPKKPAARGEAKPRRKNSAGA